jgi:hypothetical protein
VRPVDIGGLLLMSSLVSIIAPDLFRCWVGPLSQVEARFGKI